VEGLVLSSVVPAQTELLEAMWFAHPGLGSSPLHVVSHLSPTPYRIDVDQPHTVGADRFCNVAGAVELGHRDAIVVDLGTANTFDVLDDGVFLGGLIGPGAVTAHRALVESGARLPQTGFAWSSGLVGRNTADAIQAGSYHQAVGAVAHVINRLLERFPASSVLVTGGLAEVLGPELGDRILHLPSLTHVGAAAIGRAAAA
jgi:type III pantothenate kinase